MAYDLIAKISMIDNATRVMRKVAGETSYLKRAIDKVNVSSSSMSKAMEHGTTTASRLGRAASNTFSAIGRGASASAASVGSLRSQFLGLATAIGGAMAAKSAWDNTVVSAAKNELSQIQISAMFTDDGKAKEYMESLRKMAVDSPLLNSNQMFANSKSFIGQTRDLKTLEHAWKVAEKLMAWSPEQSVESVVFAMRELSSGDAISMVERFELPRDVLNNIKKLKFDDQLKEMDKLLAKLRITDDYIEKIGAASLSQWNQIKEKMDVALTDIGMGALEELKPTLIAINNAMDGQGFKNFKDNVAKAVAGGFREILNAGKSAYSYIERAYLNNTAFQKLDFKAKFNFVIDDLYAHFKSWYAAKGSAQLQSAAKTLIMDLSKIIENNSVEIVSIGASIGKSLAVGAVQGFAEGIGSIVNTLGDNLQAKYRQFTNWVDVAVEGKAPKKLTTPGIPLAKNNNSLASQSFGNTLKLGGSFAKGTESVPHDMLAQIHKGEMIIPKVQADIIRKFGIDNIIEFPTERAVDTITNNNSVKEVFNNATERFFTEKTVPVTNTETVKYVPQSIATSTPSEPNRSSGPISIQFGDINISGASGDIEEMADKFMRIIARRLSEADELMA